MPKGSWMNGPPKKILLASDLSARCDRAMDRAIRLASEWNAELVIVHVMEDTAVLDDGSAVIPSWRRSADPHQIAEERIRGEFPEFSSDFSVVIEAGDPADAILRTARSQGCDLIITGVARDESLGRIALGSTVTRLKRLSEVPLLIVRRRGNQPYRQVVVASDFSESSRHALEAAVRFFPHQRLTLFNAFDVPLSGLVSDRASYAGQLRDMAEQDSEAFLKGSDLSGWPGRKPEILLEQGEPDRLLYDYANKANVDLVVAGTHGRSAIFQALIGSVAQRIVDGLQCDVMVVREPRATNNAE